jgi:hypothetical protein
MGLEEPLGSIFKPAQSGNLVKQQCSLRIVPQLGSQLSAAVQCSTAALKTVGSVGWGKARLSSLLVYRHFRVKAIAHRPPEQAPGQASVRLLGLSLGLYQGTRETMA